MIRHLRLPVALALLLLAAPLAQAQAERPAAHPDGPSVARPSEHVAPAAASVEKSGAPVNSVNAGTSAAEPVSADPLIRVLVAKGVLTPDEGRSINAGGNPAEQRKRLAALLRDKGLITETEFEAVRTVAASAGATSPTVALPAERAGATNPEGVRATQKAATPSVIAAVAPQRPVRAQGGFIQFGLPLSRIFDADASGRHAGWTAYVYYGYDQAMARDARRFSGGARGSRSDLFLGSLQYKLNTFVTFAYEQGYYRTRAANRVGALPLFRGIPSYATHNVRSEFATIFTF
jgi:hypothetical protein